MNELKKIDRIAESTNDIFLEFLESRKEKIRQIPKLAFLSLHKPSTKRSTRFLGEIYSKNLVKLVSSTVSNGRFTYAVYLDCINGKFTTYDNKGFSTIDLLTIYLNHRKSFDVDSLYQKLFDASMEEIDNDAFYTTKTFRKNPEETALNYFIYLMNKANNANLNISFEDLKSSIGSNKILSDFLKTEDDLKKVKNEMIVKSATSLLKQ